MLRLQGSNSLDETLPNAGNPENPAVLVYVTTVVDDRDMVSDNPSGADNQQERPSSSSWPWRVPRDLGNWIAGFVDGEGSFNVPLPS
jgi:hypothetical protein